MIIGSTLPKMRMKACFSSVILVSQVRKASGKFIGANTGLYYISQMMQFKQIKVAN
jgi:hypothetical protein